ncbi:MAG: hypothetical protein E6340_08205 [Actinomyces sp.]|jgi:hypothetical protein|nr:hypothetical protein [Actinomyces sp.]
MFITVVLGTAVAFTAYRWGVDRIGAVVTISVVDLLRARRVTQ